jgi:hypothetical protein
MEVLEVRKFSSPCQSLDITTHGFKEAAGVIVTNQIRAWILVTNCKLLLELEFSGDERWPKFTQPSIGGTVKITCWFNCPGKLPIKVDDFIHL